MKNSGEYNKLVILLVLLIFSTAIILSGCNGVNPAEETDKQVEQDQIMNEAPNNDEKSTPTDATEDQSVDNSNNDAKPIDGIEGIINNIIETQKNAVLNKNRQAYLSTLNDKDKLLLDDNNAWFYRISKGDLKDFTYEVTDILSEKIDIAVAAVHLKYTVDENAFDLTYPMRFEKTNNSWYCSGPDYKEIVKDNLKVLYFDKDQKYGEMVMEAAEKSYKTVLNNFNYKDTKEIAVKFYDNSSWLRQFAYPTYKWEFTAWAVGDGNISLTSNTKAENDEERKTSFIGTLTHEITHEISYSIANYKSFPQWLFEGIAEYYAGPPIHATPYDDLRLWTIDELDSNILGELVNDDEIRSFYYTGSRVVKYLIDNYGEAKINELLKAIGESSISDDKWMDRFTEAFAGTYGIKYDDFKELWVKHIKNK